MDIRKTLLSLCLLISLSAVAQKSTLTREYISPVRIIKCEGDVKNPERLLKEGIGQSTLSNADVCAIKGRASIILDFGKELHGGLQVVTGMSPTAGPQKLHLTFGESVSESMSREGEKGATNDHAMRCFEMQVPWLGVAEIGNSGYRFLRIETIDENATLYLREIRAISIYRDIERIGLFTCDDTLLNKIWDVGAHTVHLCMQDYLWDGIKRDRLVWIGDMMPEVMSVFSVFGADDIIPRSLDLTREATPLPGWMNGISSYSLWWILLHEKWYQYTGDVKYLEQQADYLFPLLEQVISTIDKDGREHLGGSRFLDWPSNANTQAVDAGLQALTVMTLESGEKLCRMLGNETLADKCHSYHQKAFAAARKVARDFVKKNTNPTGEKQAVALLSLCGAMDSEEAASIIEKNTTDGFSTFYGYFMCEALAKAGHHAGAMDIIKRYWGGMLDMGATTFWEDFDLRWTENAAPIDQIVPAGRLDIHGDFGAYCYKGFRHSLCHGWASGPTSWLSHHVLGVEVMDTAFSKVRIVPHLGNLKWVKGSYPTPYGAITISHRVMESGEIETEISAPEEITIIRE